MALKVLTGFDGTCFRGRDSIRQPARGVLAFTMQANTRFYTRLRNSSRAPIRRVLQVAWPAADYIDLLDYAYYRHETEREWTMIPGYVSGARVRYPVDLAPGLTEVAQYPEYTVAQCNGFAAELRARGVRVRAAGRSREGRILWLMALPSPNPAARNFLIQARDHPYETAGSYGVEGIADFLLAGSELAAYLRSKFQVYLLPMSNPDGVYHGLSRYTTLRGRTDMNRVHTAADPAHATVKRVLDRIKPQVYMNIHNYTYKYTDGMYAHQEWLIPKIRRNMPDDAAHSKRWDIASHFDFLKAKRKLTCPPEHKSWKNYCYERWETRGVNFELPWFRRNTAAMRQVGRQAFIALALAVIDDDRM